MVAKVADTKGSKSTAERGAGKISRAAKPRTAKSQIAKSQFAKSQFAKSQVAKSQVAKSAMLTGASVVMEEARRAGLLDGDKTEHVSFRAPKALLDAAKRQSGTTRPTELGLLALAMLAQPDPTAKFLKETRGALGPDHQLDY